MNPAAAKPCPFCHLDPKRVLAADELTVACKHGFPVSLDHTLIILRYRGDKEEPRGGVRRGCVRPAGGAIVLMRDHALTL